jgi:nickel-dependent lactate racemase
MEISLRYGKRTIKANLPDGVQRLDFLEPEQQQIGPIHLALAAPMGGSPLSELAKAGQKVAIVTSDITRPCPSQLLLPPLLDELNQAGVEDADIFVVFALGSHRPHTVEEQKHLLGPIAAKRVRYMDSNPEEVVYAGTTSRGTRVEIFQPVAEADLRIALGNVEPHYFAGYTGGAKALVPGVCSLKTIQQNHALMVLPGARICNLVGNPVREDIEEAVELVGLDFILNVVLDNDHNIVTAAAGDPLEAHRQLCRVVDYLSTIAIDALADIVIVSAGGYPKDLNMYQAQKALDNAAGAVRPGGVIVWIAECPDGFGNSVFEQWLVGSKPDEILQRLSRNFVLGGHKAGAVARLLQRSRVILVSNLPPELVEQSGLIHASELSTALETALRLVQSKPSVTVMPHGAKFVVKFNGEFGMEKRMERSY